MMKKKCFLFNYPSHYRLRIYSLLDEAYNSSFIFGDEDLRIKKFDISSLKDARYVHVRNLGHYVFQSGIISTIFKDYDFYVLTAGTNDISHWIFLLISKLFWKKKVYIWTHGVYGYENKLRMLVRKAYFGLADGLFIYGNYAKEKMISMGYPTEKFHVIHNSLDYDHQVRIRKKIQRTSIYTEHFGNEQPVLIFIGRLTKVKKLSMLLDAVSILRKRGKYYNVVFVGDGEERLALEERIKELDLSQFVWFYGACYDEEENARLLYNADLCVSPGNVGLTSIHSLTFGTPVLTHNDFMWQMPEFEAIKDGVTGCFFEKDNENSLATCIEEWIEAKKDKREETRTACYDVIDKEWNPYYQMEVFKSVLGE